MGCRSVFLRRGQDVLRDRSRFDLSAECRSNARLRNLTSLIERDGIDPAAYVGRYKWVRIADLNAVTPDELKALIGKSYRQVFDKLAPKVKKSLKGKCEKGEK